jgi:Putative prokaryotic signal transducing protein
MSDEVEIFKGEGGAIEQALYESILRSEGIRFVVKGSGISEHPFSVGPMSVFRIYVANEDEDRARELLANLEEAEPTEGGPEGSG